MSLKNRAVFKIAFNAAFVAAAIVPLWTYAADVTHTYKEIRIGSGEWYTPPGCSPSVRLDRLSAQVIELYPALLTPEERGRVTIKYLLCKGSEFREANSAIKRWGNTVEATITVREDMTQRGTLRLAVVLAHEISHVGNAAEAGESAAGPDGHGYSWLKRTVQAGLPSIAFEAVDPNGPFAHYLSTYRQASMAVCGRASCGPESVDASGLAQLRE